MTIDSEADALGASPRGHRGHHHHGASAHEHPLEAERAPAAGFSPFLASALDRLAIAVVLSGLVWIGVVWALR